MEEFLQNIYEVENNLSYKKKIDGSTIYTSWRFERCRFKENY